MDEEVAGYLGRMTKGGGKITTDNKFKVVKDYARGIFKSHWWEEHQRNQS